MNDKQHPPPPPPPAAGPAASAGAAKALGKRPWSKPTIRVSDGIITISSGGSPRPTEGTYYTSP